MGKKNRTKNYDWKEASARKSVSATAAAVAAAPAPERAPRLWKDAGRNAAACAVVAALGLLVFAQVYDQTYVNYDDGIYITDNRDVQAGLTAQNIVWAFAEPHIGHYHPLTWISYMIDISLFGMNSGAMKLVNMTFHIANSLLLFWVLRRLTGTYWRSLFVAAVFAVHPIHVEPVAWVASRKDMLSGFFFMLTLLTYARYGKEKNRISYGLSWFFFLLGILSKPMLITLPCLLLLLDWWPLRRFSRDTFPYVDLPALYKCTLEKIPFFFLSGLSAFLTYYAGKKQDVLGTSDMYPIAVRAENALRAYGKYFRQCFWPSDLAPYYPHPGANIDVFYVILAASFLCAATALVILAVRRYPFAATGWFWFIGMLVPVIGVIQISDHSMADRYMYLPLAGVAILVAWSAEALTAGRAWQAKVWGAAAPAAVLALTILGYIQTTYWHDDEALYRYALSIEPDAPKMQTNLGITLRRQGKLDEAYKECKGAVEDNPNYADARMNMANVLYDMGRYAEAETEYREAIRMSPQNDNAYSNLGNVLVKLNRHAEAIELYQKALSMKEGNASAHNNLGGTLFELKRYDEAKKEFEKAIALDGNYIGAYTNYAVLNAQQGNFKDAAKLQEKAIRLKPNDPLLLNMLGNFYFQQGMYSTSIEKYADVLKADPKNVDARYSTGSAYARLGDSEKAISWYDSALELNPNYTQAKSDRETVLRRMQAPAAPAVPQATQAPVTPSAATTPPLAPAAGAPVQ